MRDVYLYCISVYFHFSYNFLGWKFEWCTSVSNWKSEVLFLFFLSSDPLNEKLKKKNWINYKSVALISLHCTDLKKNKIDSFPFPQFTKAVRNKSSNHFIFSWWLPRCIELLTEIRIRILWILKKWRRIQNDESKTENQNKRHVDKTNDDYQRN